MATPSMFSTYSDLWFAGFCDHHKIDLFVTKALLDGFFLSGQKADNLISVGWAKLASLVRGDKLLIKSVYRIHRSSGLNGILF